MFVFIVALCVAGLAFHFWYVSAPLLAVYAAAKLYAGHVARTERRKG